MCIGTHYDCKGHRQNTVRTKHRYILREMLTTLKWLKSSSRTMKISLSVIPTAQVWFASSLGSACVICG